MIFTKYSYNIQLRTSDNHGLLSFHVYSVTRVSYKARYKYNIYKEAISLSDAASSIVFPLRHRGRTRAHYGVLELEDI